MNTVPSNIFRPRPAASYLSISVATLYRLANAGELHRIRLAKRAVGFSKAALDEYIARRSA